MGIKDKRQLDTDRDDAEFQQLLASFGEPAPIAVPPDLVVRTARRLPQQPPQVVLRRQQTRIALRFSAIVLLIIFVAFGLLSQHTGPSSIPFGSENVGLGRVLLISQLALKPLLATISSLSLLLIGVGISAIIGSMLIVRFAAQPLSSQVSRRG